MPATRRSVSVAAVAALMATHPMTGRAQPRGWRSAPDEQMDLTPLSPSAGRVSRYAAMANPGPRGLPRAAVEIEPTPGQRLNVWLPARPGTSRIVVFSHGELGMPQIYERLLSHWASHGFVVVAPIHDDSVIEGGLALRRRDPRSGGAFDLDALINDADAWRARARTCRAALESVGVIERGTGMRISADRPIIAGHSFGAYTAQLLLGARALTGSGVVLDEVDPRFYGGMLLSPQGRGVMGLMDGSWDTVSRPMLVVTGHGDADATRQSPEVKAEPFALAPEGNKHLAWLSRAWTTIFSGQQLRPGSSEEALFHDVLSVTTAFLVAYGGYEDTVFQELAGDYYTRMTSGRIVTRYR